MRLPKITSLYGRIFAIFWFTMFLVLMAVLSLPHFDPRKVSDIPEPYFKRLLEARDRVQMHFADAQSIDTVIAAMSQHHERDADQRRGDRGFDFFLTDLDGNVLRQHGRPSPEERAVRNLVTNIDNPAKPQQRLYGRYMLSGPLPIKLAQADYYLYIGLRWNRPPSFIFQLFDHPFQLLLATMIVSTPLLLWLAWALSQPARRLEQAAQRVARGEFATDPMLEKGTSEFRQAGASFNQMVEAVNQMISRQQRLLSDISHELRSPLTRLRMANSLAQRKQGQSPELTRIDTETQRLESMINNLLDLSRMQIDSHTKRELQPLASLWEPLLQDTQYEAEQIGKTLHYSSIPEHSIMCHPQLMMSALENLVRNAVYYGDSHVQVSMEVIDNELIVSVEDDGEGVPEAEREEIFRPFYRVSTARDANSGGTGLGLAITENAIRQHNGSIKASESELGGLLVTVRLPLSA
ncbi:envelope stress sensor histidine kinase CpxA [Marinomonas ostreistagni]|uniref:envelope stress sensor histidine kinase CpxA n=1 Tax=Marinomonas ostreistagni TaxID=359209 RepID=UPI00194F3D21|nr:envelope stress sensor histidine kinase CpxA [Marinomonas ostreistagni]MBM6550053.1 envelope stress sensor histidine kinase CpxA [Marinomonas ostreistagni]